jgi:outer membrane protein OmpA-like peptidoglycan-associated protein
MRPSILSAVLLTLAPLMTVAPLLTVAPPAFAQVTLDLHALQALPERGGTNAPAHIAPSTPQHTSGRTQTATPRPQNALTETPVTDAAAGKNPASEAAPATMASRSAASQPTAPSSTAPSSTATAAPPAMPQTVPQTAMITPIAPAPPAAESAPPPPVVSDKAATSAAPTVSGLRVTFASGQFDLSPESVSALKQLTAATPSGEATSYNVMAYAMGSPDDPSTARRVSLSRAMAVRSALIADGVASSRIYVRALGAQSGDGPADRVDVNVAGSNDPGPAPAQATTR